MGFGLSSVETRLLGVGGDMGGGGYCFLCCSLLIFIFSVYFSLSG